MRLLDVLERSAQFLLCSRIRPYNNEIVDEKSEQMNQGLWPVVIIGRYMVNIHFSNGLLSGVFEIFGYFHEGSHENPCKSADCSSIHDLSIRKLQSLLKLNFFILTCYSETSNISKEREMDKTHNLNSIKTTKS